MDRGELLGGISDVRMRYQQRYVPGQRLYLSEVQPERWASVVIDNSDPGRPAVAKVRRDHRDRR